MNVHYQHWTMADRRILDRATTLEEMAEVALAVVRRHPLGLHFVSGPISTGGTGDPEVNRAVLRAAITELSGRGFPVWSQMPFEERLKWFDGEWRKSPENTGYCEPILWSFYDRVLSTGRFEVMHFLHGFESSVGAKWEYERCERWKISPRVLPQSFSRGIGEALSCASSR